MSKNKKSEQGQSAVMFALVMSVMTMFMLVVLNYMVVSTHAMRTRANLSLALHAGAQAIRLNPDGSIENADYAEAVVMEYYLKNPGTNDRPGGISCGEIGPKRQIGCRGFATSVTRFWRTVPIRVESIAYLIPGVTRPEQ